MCKRAIRFTLLPHHNQGGSGLTPEQSKTATNPIPTAQSMSTKELLYFYGFCVLTALFQTEKYGQNLLEVQKVTVIYIHWISVSEHGK
jgi:hypothetical protein